MRDTAREGAVSTKFGGVLLPYLRATDLVGALQRVLDGLVPVRLAVTCPYRTYIV